MRDLGLHSDWLLYMASQQQGDLRLSGQGAGGGARTRNRRIPADLRADSLATVPPTPRLHFEDNNYFGNNSGKVGCENLRAGARASLKETRKRKSVDSSLGRGGKNGHGVTTDYFLLASLGTHGS
ncbi:hypothetical protein PoB_002316600 [Plakobranchus ocellatus]|uniref:Uncharacterized protein n=1 Tax=Plakobranchus ocellatus TaxID=259542 RepID=A0AAV3ZL63_9GAST|nr:hypothetical protein PoB_002316600 [Plakobranchus ocellatus]